MPIERASMRQVHYQLIKLERSVPFILADVPAFRRATAHRGRGAVCKIKSKVSSMPFRVILARLRQIIPSLNDTQYEILEKGFRDGELKQPTAPMSDAELSRTLREFLEFNASAQIQKSGNSQPE